MIDQRVHTGDNDALTLIEALRTHLPVMMQKHQTPGLNIAVADKGRLVWEAGFGLADIAEGRPMTPDTVYHSGSLAKTYTATAIMILVDRGVIALEDPINKHLPFAVRNPLGSRDITVRDLMAHLSGLGSDSGATRWSIGRSLAEDLATEYAKEWCSLQGGLALKRWIHPVGTAWCYSNLGVATLGLIVEFANAKGLSFSEFVQQNIMDPLGMANSCFPKAQHPNFVPKKIWAQTSRGYSRMGSVDIPTIPIFVPEFPAGCVLAPPADHIRLLLAMMNDGELDGYRLFAPEIARAMIAPAVGREAMMGPSGNPLGDQGLIWQLNDYGRAWASFDHVGGHMFGWRTQGRAWPRYKSAVVVAANQWSLPDDTMEVQEVVEFVGTWLRFRRSTDAPPLDAAAVSYARGVLLAGAYRAVLGIPGNFPSDALDRIAAGVRNRGRDWDAAAFRRGFEAVAALPPTPEAIRNFLRSDSSAVDAATFQAACETLGMMRAASFLSCLLPSD